MKRTTLFLDEQLEHDLKALSKQQGRPLAVVVRQAMAEYVAKEAGARRPSVGFVAAGRSGRSDTAERHEELLWAELGPHDGPAGSGSRRASGMRRNEPRTTPRRPAKRR